MNLEFFVNDYLLAWYLLYSASLSKEIDKLRKSLWSKYKKEYNFCYKDKQEIIKYGKDFIPDNDTIYNEVFESEVYKSLKKETNKHKMHLVRLFENNSKVVKKCCREVLKLDLKETYPVYIIHPRMECIEYNRATGSLIWGSDKDKYDAITRLILTIVQGYYENYNNEYKEIVESVIELAVINEISKQLTNQPSYDIGDATLKIIKRQIYPFWLMYLGNDTKEQIINKMMEDKIAFDIDYYPIDKNMKKMSLTRFIDFCIKNNRHILKLGNVLKIEKDDEIEVI